MKNRTLFCILTAIFLVVFINISYSQTSQPLPAQEQNQILKTITEKLSAVNNLKAEFKQSRHMEILIDPLVSDDRVPIHLCLLNRIFPPVFIHFL